MVEKDTHTKHLNGHFLSLLCPANQPGTIFKIDRKFGKALLMHNKKKYPICVNAVVIIFLTIIVFFLLFYSRINNKKKLITLNKENLPILIKKIGDATRSNNPLHVNSSGGMTSIALTLAQEIGTNTLPIVVSKECSSNCAEILLPAGQSVYFRDNPIIAFHGNTISYKHFVESDDSVDSTYCNWIYVDEILDLYSSRGVNQNFWKEQMLRLQPNVEFKILPNKCPWRIYNFKNEAWLPTSKQLRELLKLNFEGSVCADDLKECKKRIDRRWIKGARIVVGDEVYISKGH